MVEDVLKFAERKESELTLGRCEAETEIRIDKLVDKKMGLKSYLSYVVGNSCLNISAEGFLSCMPSLSSLRLLRPGALVHLIPR